MDTNLIGSAVRGVIGALLATEDIKTATKYLSPDYTVRGTLVDAKHRDTNRKHIKLSIGAPNFAERKFIQDCIAADELFPVRKVQLRHRSRRR